MAVPDTYRADIPAEVNNFYNRTLLERLRPYLQFLRFGQVRDIPRKVGTNVIKFRRYNTLAAATTPLTEGTTPTGISLTVTDITATVAQYGDYTRLSDIVMMQSIDPVLTEAAEVFGEQAADTLEELARDVLSAGTTIRYANGVASRGVVAATISLTDVQISVRTLQVNKAKKITRIVNPDTGYATSPINAAFVGLVGPDALLNLKNLTGWVPIEKYANKADVMEGEAGALDEVRFVLTQNAKKWAGEGANGADVYATIILGKDAYGYSRISGEAIRNIVKPLGSAGAADPLEQRATTGWKATFVAKILNELAMIRIESTAS